jgi:SPP1 family predicted phage head-tail adaptor
MAKRSGDFWRPIQIQANTVSRSSTGEISRSWATVYQRRAAIEDVTGSEGLRGQALGADITHVVRMRYLANLSPAMRILHGPKILEIVTILDRDGHHVEHEVHCREAIT